MTTTHRVVLSILAVCAPLWALVGAQDRPQPRSTGRVLLLRNQGILEGDIERHGDRFRVRRATGEIWVGTDRALYLCADWEEAFAMLSREANLRDADERMRLARWCEHNGLHKHALAEAAAAVKLRPNHPGAKHLLARLQSVAAQASSPAPKVAREPEEKIPAVDLNAESLALFSTRIQPILMNACANCHATGRGGQFKLVRCYDATLNRRALHQNLAAVLAQIDLEEPPVSKLLYKAVSAHGGAAQAPLSGRQSVPFQALQEWVARVIANNPHLRKEPGRSRKTASAASSVQPQQAETPAAAALPQARMVSLPRPVQRVETAVAAPAAGANPLPPTGPPAPVAPSRPPTTTGQAPAPVIDQAPAPATTQTSPRDEFDPWIFNTKLR